MAAKMSAATPWPRVICLGGVDGTGKTTQARALLRLLEADDVDAERVWLRFPRLFCVPLLVYARLRGYSVRERVDGVEHGYWYFDRSWLMRNVFPWLLLLDTLLLALVKLHLPLRRGRTIVCDRFVADILVDLMTGLNDSRFYERLPGRLFWRLVPPDASTIVLDLESPVARERSRELLGDRSHEQRRALYLNMAADLGLPVVDSRAPVATVTAEVVHILQSEEAEAVRADQQKQAKEGKMNVTKNEYDEAVRNPSDGFAASRDDGAVEKSTYAKVDSPLLKLLLGNRPGVLASHWLFQGLLYMDSTERAFKLGLDLALLLVFFRLLRAVVGWRAALVAGALAAHTMNFLFNGQIWAALKHFGGIANSASEFNGEVDRLRRRVREEPAIAYAAAYGSLARGEWSPTSDLDVRLVRAPGARNGWRASVFALRERARAFVRGFPLDLFVFDSEGSLAKLAERQHPVVLKEVEAETAEEQHFEPA